MGPWETVPIPQLFWMAWCGNPWFGLLRCFLHLVSLNNILFLKLHFQIYIRFAFVSEVTSRCRNSAIRLVGTARVGITLVGTPYRVTGALITSKLQFTADYRTLGLSIHKQKNTYYLLTYLYCKWKGNMDELQSVKVMS